MKTLYDNIRIVLVNPLHPGNIGGVARAMKNMGFNQLWLVNPKQFPHVEATARATHAADILEHTIVVPSLEEALVGCHLVMGTSARMRTLPQSLLTPRQAAALIVEEPQEVQIALLFGNEKFGLCNQDLRLCHYHICIPTVEDCRSLNLAMAVQVVVYELYIHALEVQGQSPLYSRTGLAPKERMEGLYQHIQETITEIGFLDPRKPKRLMPRIRQIIDRSRIDKDELDLLRGMMTAMQRYVKKCNSMWEKR